MPDWDKRDIAGMSTEAHATSRAKLLAQLMYSQARRTEWVKGGSGRREAGRGGGIKQIAQGGSPVNRGWV